MSTLCSFTFMVEGLGCEGSRCNPGAASHAGIVVRCPPLEDNEGMWCHSIGVV